MRILGIETSCDETAAAIIEAKKDDSHVTILSNIIASSLSLHAKTGGIIPEIAARQQIRFIIPVINQALEKSNLYPPASKIHLPSSTIYRPNIDAIAVTYGPGLIGSLLIGVETAKTLSYIWKKPIIPVNHLVGHIYANFIRVDELQPTTYNLQPEVTFPSLALIVSGGHTDLVLIKEHGSIKWLGGTRDDAAGEALDKIGRLLGLPYPGGPEIEKAAKKGNPKAFNFPRPLANSNDFDFSFSGLKTAVLNLIKYGKLPNSHSGLSRIRCSDSGQIDSGVVSPAPPQNDEINNICASVQAAIIDVLVSKTLKAAQKYEVKTILLSGGVAANQKLREEFALKIENLKLKIPLFFPEKRLCTDNAAMIASAAFFNYKEIPRQKLTSNPELYF